MQLAWTHLLPATFSGRARMNVQNTLAAAAAAFAAGAPLHDIRQGLRTFSTNYYLSPGRLNEVDVERRQRHRRLLPQRPGHADARRLRRPGRRDPHGDLRARQAVADRGHRHGRRPPRRGHARARRGRGAALRRRDRPRGRRPAAARARRDTSALVAEGVRRRWPTGARCKQVEIVLDEIEAVRHAMARANPGDLVVICVDKHGRGDERAGDLVDLRPGRLRREPRRPVRRPGLHAGPEARRDVQAAADRALEPGQASGTASASMPANPSARPGPSAAAPRW